VERVLPRGAVVVVVAPGAAQLGTQLRRLEALKVVAFLAPTQGFSDARAFADALMTQLGIDLRSPPALEAAGLDGQGALGVAVLVSAQALLAVPVKDPRKLQERVAALALSRLGAGATEERTVEGVAVRTFARNPGGAPALGYVLTQGYALVATGAAVSQLAGLARLTEADSLAADRELATLRGRAGAAPDLYAWAPLGSPLLVRLPVTGALLSARLGPAGLALDLEAPWKPGAPEALALEAREGEGPGPVLPEDAFLTGRYQGDPPRAAALLLELLGPGVRGALEKAQVDLGSQLLSALRPGAVGALSLADRPPLGRGLPSLDPRATNPFAYVHLSGAAPLTSADAGVEALERLAAAAPGFGARLERVQRGGVPAFLTTWAQGEGVHFAVQPGRLLFAAPLTRLDALLAQDGGVPGPGGEGTLGLRLDVRRLAASVRALPESAWGLGGFAMKATAVRWLEAVDDLTALDLQARSAGGALQARLALELQLGAPQVRP
jgi:hypothetical protein